VPDLSLNQFAQIAGSNAVSGLARTVGLKWPPPPAISLRDLIKRVGESFYITQHYDNGRVGWTPFEQTLTVSAVRDRFKLLFEQKVSHIVLAQPLYVRNVAIPGTGSHNIVFVATLDCSIWAFDADTQMPVLWHRQLLSQAQEIPRQFQYTPTNPDLNYGLVSTPVINPLTGNLYAVCATQTQTQPVQYHHRIYALDIATGKDLPGTPVEIEGSFGDLKFDSHQHLNRSGLLLHDGVIYIAFASYGDNDPYHGWIFAYDSTSLHQVGAFCSTPASTLDQPGRGGIWQSGMGLAADSDGYIYFATGNGAFNADAAGGRSYGSSVLKLRRTMAVADYFTPCNYANLSVESVDQDLGSGGVMVVPYQHGRHPKLLLACGKEGTIYVIDRNNMGQGKSSQPSPDLNSICNDPIPPLVDRQVRAVGGAPTNIVARDALFGGPTYFEDRSGTLRCYYCGSYPLDPAPLTPEPDHLKAFRLDATTGTLTPPQALASEESVDSFAGEGGSIPVVSSNGSSNGIVWQIDRRTFDLVAFDATNLGTRLVRLPTTHHPSSPFLVPTVMNGKVYVASNTSLFVFGLG
jgi:hypothetical protein